MFLLSADCTNRSWAMDFTLFGVFQAKQEVDDFITGYNSKVETFKKENAELIKAANDDPVDRPEFKKYTYHFASGMKGFDFDKIEKAPKEINSLLEKVQEQQQAAVTLLHAKAEKDGIVLMEDDNSQISVFTFEAALDNYTVTEFTNGQPQSLAGYEE